MNIDDLTISQARAMASLFGGQPRSRSTSHPYVIGQPYLIRTVTYAMSGVLAEVFERELVLKDAAWIADTGRFGEAIRTGNFSEVEALPDDDVIIGRGSIIDAIKIPSVPRTTK